MLAILPPELLLNIISRLPALPRHLLSLTSHHLLAHVQTFPTPDTHLSKDDTYLARRLIDESGARSSSFHGCYTRVCKVCTLSKPFWHFGTRQAGSRSRIAKKGRTCLACWDVNAVLVAWVCNETVVRCYRCREPVRCRPWVDVRRGMRARNLKAYMRAHGACRPSSGKKRVMNKAAMRNWMDYNGDVAYMCQRLDAVEQSLPEGWKRREIMTRALKSTSKEKGKGKGKGKRKGKGKGTATGKGKGGDGLDDIVEKLESGEFEGIAELKAEAEAEAEAKAPKQQKRPTQVLA